MDVDAVADARGRGDWRKACLMAQAQRAGAGDFAQDHGLVGGAQAGGGRAGDFELARAVLGHEAVGLDAGLVLGFPRAGIAFFCWWAGISCFVFDSIS